MSTTKKINDYFQEESKQTAQKRKDEQKEFRLKKHWKRQ